MALTDQNFTSAQHKASFAMVQKTDHKVFDEILKYILTTVQSEYPRKKCPRLANRVFSAGKTD